MTTEKDNPCGYCSQRVEVAPELQTVYSHFYFAHNQSNSVMSHTFIPTYRVLLIFSLGTPVSIRLNAQAEQVIERYLILGPVKQAFDYCLPPGARIIVVNFAGDGFHRLFGSAGAEQALAAGFDDNCFSQLWQYLQHHTDIGVCTQHLLALGQSYLRRVSQHEADLSPYLQTEHASKTVAAHYGKHPRTIQMQYKKRLGFSAREFSRHQRFIRAIEYVQTALESEEIINWADLIFACGYYDQSHLIRDFQHYLAISPSRYLDLQQQLCFARS